MPLASYLRPVLTDYVGELVWLHAAEEYAVTRCMSKSAGVLQYALHC